MGPSQSVRAPWSPAGCLENKQPHSHPMCWIKQHGFSNALGQRVDPWRCTLVLWKRNAPQPRRAAGEPKTHRRIPRSGLHSHASRHPPLAGLLSTRSQSSYRPTVLAPARPLNSPRSASRAPGPSRHAPRPPTPSAPPRLRLRHSRPRRRCCRWAPSRHPFRCARRRRRRPQRSRRSHLSFLQCCQPLLAIGR